MRYVRYKTITSKIFDDILEDPEDIQNLLNELKSKEITCAMQVGFDPRHAFVRILEVDQTKITWSILEKGVSLRKTSLISDIKTLEVEAGDDLVVLKPKPSRWSMLDTSGI